MLFSYGIEKLNSYPAAAYRFTREYLSWTERKMLWAEQGRDPL